MDLSQVSDSDLMALHSKVSQPQPQSNTDLSKMSDSDLMALKTKLNTAPTSNDLSAGNTSGTPNTLQAVANSPTVSKVLATGGGIAADIGKGASYINKLGSGVAHRLGLIDDKTKSAYDAHIDQKFAPPAVSQQAMAEHPNYAEAGNIIAKAVPAAGVGAALGASSTALGASKLASWVPSAISNLGSNASLGAMLSPDGHEVAGAVGGAAGGAAIGAAGALIGKLASSSAPAIKVGLKNLSNKAMNYLADPTADAQTNAVNAVVSHFNNAKALVDAAEEKFRGVPGTYQASELHEAVDHALANFSDEMTGSQKAILQRVSDKLAEPQSMGSIIDIKRALNSNYKLFHNPMNPNSAELGDAFNGVLKSADSQIANTMQSAGHEDLYGKYKELYNSSLKPLRDLKIDTWANLPNDSDAFAVKSQAFFKKMVNANNPREIQSLRNMLGSDANKAVTSHFMSLAADSATDAEGNLKVGNLLNTLDKIKKTGAIPEGSDEAAMMDGVRKIALNSKRLDLLHHIPFVGDVVSKTQGAGQSGLYYAGKLLNSLPNSALGQAALKKIGISPEGNNLATRALEHAIQTTGALEGQYQAGKISQ